MKHIIKVDNLSNLPGTRPLIAKDKNDNLKWLANATKTYTITYHESTVCTVPSPRIITDSVDGHILTENDLPEPTNIAAKHYFLGWVNNETHTTVYPGDIIYGDILISASMGAER